MSDYFKSYSLRVNGDPEEEEKENEGGGQDKAE